LCKTSSSLEKAKVKTLCLPEGDRGMQAAEYGKKGSGKKKVK